MAFDLDSNFVKPIVVDVANSIALVIVIIEVAGIVACAVIVRITVIV